jgi:hypothetical protein
MPFVAECTFCHLMLQKVPDHRLGSSVQCPRCRNSFTLAPMTNPPAVATREPKAVTAAPEPPVAVMEKPLSRPLWTPAPPKPAGPAVAKEPVKQDVPASVEEEESPEEPSADEPRPGAPRRPNYPGLAAFVLASFALLAASVLQIGWVTFGLGLAGLLLGVVGLFRAGARWRRVVPAAVGVGVSLPVVVIAAFFPYWLGLSPLWNPVKPPEQGDAAMSLGGGGGLRHAAEGEVLWVDASRDALHHGDVRLRVSSATVGPASFEPVVGKKPPGDRCLVIGLRVTNAGIARKITYAGWGGTQTQDGPALRDNLGNSYPEKVFDPGWVVKGRAKGAAIPPGKTLDDVLIFQAPPATVERLRLELPATAVGAEGRLRLEIPRSLIAFR